jgi:hypothetical protein
MPLSHDVKVPRGTTCTFPSRCVRCGEANPAHTWRHSTRAIGWHSLFGGWGRKTTVEVPACPRCAAELGAERRRRFLVDMVLIAAAIVVVMPLTAAVERPLRKPLGIALITLLLLPSILRQVTRPPAFDLTVTSRWVTYEFADAAYAREFLTANEDVAEWSD